MKLINKFSKVVDANNVDVSELASTIKMDSGIITRVYKQVDDDISIVIATRLVTGLQKMGINVNLNDVFEVGNV